MAGIRGIGFTVGAISFLLDNKKREDWFINSQTTTSRHNLFVPRILPVAQLFFVARLGAGCFQAKEMLRGFHCPSLSYSTHMRDTALRFQVSLQLEALRLSHDRNGPP